jgi:hypothetical protein
VSIVTVSIPVTRAASQPVASERVALGLDALAAHDRFIRLHQLLI